jgi:transposase-like protein
MPKAKYTAQFKFDRVMESFKKDSLAEVSREYGFGVNLLSKWRSDFLKAGHALFETKPNQEVERLKKRLHQMEQLVGKKEVELALIKNFTDFYESQNGK